MRERERRGRKGDRHTKATQGIIPCLVINYSNVKRYLFDGILNAGCFDYYKQELYYFVMPYDLYRTCYKCSLSLLLSLFCLFHYFAVIIVAPVGVLAPASSLATILVNSAIAPSPT